MGGPPCWCGTIRVLLDCVGYAAPVIGDGRCGGLMFILGYGHRLGSAGAGVPQPTDDFPITAFEEPIRQVGRVTRLLDVICLHCA